LLLSRLYVSIETLISIPKDVTVSISGEYYEEINVICTKMANLIGFTYVNFFVDISTS